MSQLPTTKTAEVRQLETLKLFLSVLAHEIKNTCGAIPTLCEFAARGRQPELHLTAAKNAAINTVDLMDYLMTSVELSNGTFAFIPEMTTEHFHDWFTQIMNTTRFVDLEGVDRLNVDVPINLYGTRIFTDRKLTEQLLKNIILNAVKYSTPRTAIDVKCERQESTLIITISNYGRQIPEDQLEQIFEPFYQVDKSTAGRGLGLFICKMITEALGGTIRANSSSIANLISFTIVLPNCINVNSQYQIRA